jgi:hypothetical protein
MRDRFIAIEGELTAAAVVDHARSLSRVLCFRPDSGYAPERFLSGIVAASGLASKPAPRLYHGGVSRKRQNNEDASGIAYGFFAVRKGMD